MWSCAAWGQISSGWGKWKWVILWLSYPSCLSMMRNVLMINMIIIYSMDSWYWKVIRTLWFSLPLKTRANKQIFFLFFREAGTCVDVAEVVVGITSTRLRGNWEFLLNIDYILFDEILVRDSPWVDNPLRRTEFLVLIFKVFKMFICL